MEASNLVCSYCEHFDRIGGGCSAFPLGIPDVITSGENNHSEALPNQKNDIVFKKI